MAKSKHEHIVVGLLGQYRQRPDVVAVTLFGSMAKGNVRSGSDIDIEVISTTAEKWELVKGEVDGIVVDLVSVPKEHFLSQVRIYPYLCYDYLSEKVLYDPEGIVTKAQALIGEYFASHAEVARYWEENLELMREKKSAGTHRMADIVEAYDTAERRFSEDGKISRDFLRGRRDGERTLRLEL